MTSFETTKKKRQTVVIQLDEKHTQESENPIPKQRNVKTIKTGITSKEVNDNVDTTKISGE